MTDVAHDPHYVDHLERECAALAQRVDDLEGQLARAEAMLERYERWGSEALDALDQVVVRLVAEEHGPPPHPIRKVPT